MAKASFLNTRGERREAERGLFVETMVEHYRSIAGGLYKWDGMPEDMPEGFIETTALFFSPGAGTKRVPGFGQIVVPIAPATLTIYGTPYEWLPEKLFGMPLPDATRIFEKSHDPCLWVGSSTLARIDPYLTIMKRTMQTLDVNVAGLTQPIIISGVPPGAELQGMILENDLMNGKRIIPMVKRDALNLEVLDLKAEDHTQNLISTIDWCDARILEVMASSNGVEKSSGITTMETVSGVQSVLQQFEQGLELRKAWVDKVNDRFRLDWSVSAGEGIKALTARPSPQEAPAEEEVGEDVRE